MIAISPCHSQYKGNNRTNPVIIHEAVLGKWSVKERPKPFSRTYGVVKNKIDGTTRPRIGMHIKNKD